MLSVEDNVWFATRIIPQIIGTYTGYRAIYLHVKGDEISNDKTRDV